MWAGPLHNREFIGRLQETVESLDETVYVTRPRMLGMLNLAAEVYPLICQTYSGIGRPVLSYCSGTGEDYENASSPTRYSMVSD
jgi:tRNA G26 N,N-dimethylase Trm1